MVKVLFDHNMPPAIARGMHILIFNEGHEAFALRDIFRADVPDIEYFNSLTPGRDWILISKDLRNAKKKAEKAAILRNKLVAFYLSPALQKKSLYEQAASIL